MDRTAQEIKIRNINERILGIGTTVIPGPDSLGPATDFADLPRDEKQKAYELWAEKQPETSKLQRRMVRGHLGSKFALRHSQIKAAAKQRGKPWQWRKWVDAWGDVGATAACRLRYEEYDQRVYQSIDASLGVA